MKTFCCIVYSVRRFVANWQAVMARNGSSSQPQTF